MVSHFLNAGHNIEVRRAIGNFFCFQILQIKLCSCFINCSSFLRYFSIMSSALGTFLFFNISSQVSTSSIDGRSLYGSTVMRFSDY